MLLVSVNFKGVYYSNLSTVLKPEIKVSIVCLAALNQPYFTHLSKIYPRLKHDCPIMERIWNIHVSKKRKILLIIIIQLKS